MKKILAFVLPVSLLTSFQHKEEKDYKKPQLPVDERVRLASSAAKHPTQF